ncbi:MAG TPA: stage VI sporulation protein F [Candidatus Aphodocola excrementigallinarum]|uniref:Stage VI sporulation protein F n=1 Tax=Candidatus Aphodocola excrementigallinarum TaxID=2840670 RepID=A0A9D1IQJ8_9FIRM|nr:stage VI sporulation protein F [Candidatus Aphodocola excrementigallinarum]
MGITDSFLNKVEKKTNVSKKSILDLASRLKDGDLKNEDTIRGVIEELSKLTGKEVTKEQSDKIVKAVIGDQIPNNLESMID